MTIQTLHSKLTQKQLDNIYIFTGPEVAVQKIYYNQIATIANLKIARPDSIVDVLRNLKNRSSFMSTNYCYIIQEDKEFKTNEKLQSELNKIIGDNIVIFTYTSIDKRLKFAKTFKDIIVEFEYLKPQLLKKYIEKEISLSDSNCEKLMEVCEYDYSRCLLEIDKVKQYTLAYYKGQELKPGAYDKTFITLYEDGTIYQPPKDAIFDFVDAVLSGDIKNSFNLMEQCYAVGEATLVMLSVLYNNARQLLQVQSCNSNDVVKTTGLTAWQVKCAKQKCGIFSNGDLVYLLRLIQKAEVSIKLGTLEDKIAVPYVLVNFL